MCMLLDEPTNDLDVDTLRALEEALDDFAGCAVVISHDRWFLDRLATHILAFEGDSHVEWFEGNFQAYEEDKRRAWARMRPSRIGSNTGRCRGNARRRDGRVADAAHRTAGTGPVTGSDLASLSR